MIYIDVNVFYYWLTNHERFGEKATKYIKLIEESEKAVTSILTVWLLFVLLKRTTRNFKSDVLLSYLGIPNLKIAEFNYEILKEAVEISQKYKLDLEDSIHIATALKYNCEKIISNDKDFDRAPIKREF